MFRPDQLRRRSLDTLKPYFKDILADQDSLQKPELTTALLATIPDTDLRTALQKKWDSSPGRSSAQKWKDIQTLAESGSHSGNLKSTDINEAREDIILEYTYPRLDAEVSKKLNHLLKSPFCVHPGTGRVCVPIDVEKVEDFDPLDVPKVTELLEEIDRWDAENPSASEAERQTHDYQKTRLKPFVDYFGKFVAELLKDEGAVKRERDDASEAMEF